MQIQDYNNRFNPKKNWQRILFRSDRKSQVAELHELQSLINYQQAGNFTYLYSKYSITKAISVTPIRMGPTTHQVKVTAGQVYIETPVGAYFIDTVETLLEVSPTERTFIGIVPEFTVLEGEADSSLNDPIAGGWFSGDEGSDRLVLSYRITQNEDSYPIAIVHGQGIDTTPLVFYYENNGYSRNVSKEFLAPAIREYLAQRWYEESGDFIAKGFELSISAGTYVAISPGVVYLKGYKVEKNYTAYLELPKIRSNTDPNTRYIIYLTAKGEVEMLATEKAGNNIPSGTFLLGTVEIDLLRKKYHAVNSKNRAILNSDLLLLGEVNEASETKLLQILLDRQMIDRGRDENLNLSGIFTEVFADLSRSDFTSQLYTAAITPRQLSLRSGFKSSTINFSNALVTSSSNTSIVYKDGNPLYLTSSLSKRNLISQKRATQWVTLGTQESTRAAMILTPPGGVPESSTREFGIISFNKIPALANFADANNSSLKINLTLKSVEVTLECYGFKPLEDNLILTFGNVQITEFELLDGTTVGSEYGSIKAQIDGTVLIKFKVPSNLEHKAYAVSLSNGRATASAIFSNVDSTQLINSQVSFQSSVSSIGQTFQVSAPLILTGVKVAFRKAPALTQVSAAYVSITKTKFNVPTEEVIGMGYILSSNIETSADGSKLTEITFDRPVAIDTVGQYALTISPLVPGAELFIAEVGQPNLANSEVSSIQPLVGGELVTKKGQIWETIPSSDLTFELIQGVPGAIKSEVTFQIEGLEDFHNVEFGTSVQLPQSTSFQLFYKTAGDWILFKNGIPLPTGTKVLDMKMVLQGSSSISPIVDLTQTFFTLETNLSSSTWISKTVEFDYSYSTVEVSLKYYQPIGTSISVFISSNEGETWEALTLQGDVRDEDTLVDGNIPMYAGTYKGVLGSTVEISDLNGNNSIILRKKLTIRVDFDTKDLNTVPFIQRLATIVY